MGYRTTVYCLWTSSGRISPAFWIFVRNAFFLSPLSVSFDGCPSHGLPMRNIDQLRNWACQVLGHLHYLQTTHGIVHHSLSSRTIFYNPSSMNGSPLLLMQWHLFHLTGSGSDITFPLGHPSYLAPETVLEDSISHKVNRSIVHLMRPFLIPSRTSLTSGLLVFFSVSYTTGKMSME